jgi:hypothetical protein
LRIRKELSQKLSKIDAISLPASAVRIRGSRGNRGPSPQRRSIGATLVE